VSNDDEILQRLETLNAIGVALSSERDIDSLLEYILEAARDFAHADGGTLYRVRDRQLVFEVVRNDTLALVLGGKHGQPINFAPLPLYAQDGSGNDTTVVAHAALSGKTVNIADAYAIFPHGADEGSCRQRDRRAAVDQCQACQRRSAGIFIGRSAARGIARIAGGDRAEQSPADRTTRSSVRVADQSDQYCDR